jgi:hypothetical protein
MYVPDGIHRVLFTVNGRQVGGDVLAEAGRLRLILEATRLPKHQLRLEAWLELDPKLLSHSPDKAFWRYAYLGEVDRAKTVRIPQTGSSPEGG